jgi:hypothetical protein
MDTLIFLECLNKRAQNKNFPFKINLIRKQEVVVVVVVVAQQKDTLYIWYSCFLAGPDQTRPHT